MTRFQFTIKHDTAHGLFPAEVFDELPYITATIGDDIDGFQEVTISVDGDMVPEKEMMAHAYYIGALVEDRVVANACKAQIHPNESIH